MNCLVHGQSAVFGGQAVITELAGDQWALAKLLLPAPNKRGTHKQMTGVLLMMSCMFCVPTDAGSTCPCHTVWSLCFGSSPPGHHSPPLSERLVFLINPYPFPIRNTLVPQVGQVPCVAGLPFLSVTALGLRISRLVLHFMQYASIATSRVLICDQFTTLPDKVTVDLDKEAQQRGESVSGDCSPGRNKMTATFQMGIYGKSPGALEGMTRPWLIPG